MSSAQTEEFAHAVLASVELAFARVMSGVEGQVARMPPDLEPADALRWLGDRVTELLAGFAELPLERVLGMAKNPVPTRRPDGVRDTGPTSGGSTPPGEPIVVRAARGSVLEARVWVHAVGEVPPASLRFALSDLVGPDGDQWSAAGAVFAPAVITVPAPAETSTLLRVRIPDAAPVGDHHGLVIGRGVRGAVVPITVVIT